jgi:hypothetical protein
MAKVRVVAWWAMISIVCVALAAFIVFDVLDLDGSNLSRGSSENTLTADQPNLEAERLLSLAGDPSSAPITERLFTLLSPPLDSVVARPTATPPALRARVRIVHLHAGKDDAQRAVSPSRIDPA